ncbi:hypothetical protein Sjap_015650 [Stephania japonica]|uniref:Uncharacterized protein n=1 Tax=Stephania japonica TaxID=461633 RepID=A0AAP0IKL7_9MAGN
MIAALQTHPSKPLPQNQNPNKHSSISNGSSSSSTTTTDSGLLFRQKVLYLEALKVDTTKALTINPSVRTAPLQSLKSVQRCLHSMGVHSSAHGRLFDMFPSLLTCDPHADLYPVLDFLLHDVAIPFRDVEKCVIRCPRLLISDVPRQLRPALYFLRRLGFVGRHAVDCHTTVLLVSSVEDTLIPKLEFVQSLGFSYRDTVWMVLRNPALLTYSVEGNLRPKADYFLNEMKGDSAELKRFPQYFAFSLERKIKPRHRLLLDHGFEMSLPEMLKVSDGKFSNRLVEMRLQSLDEKLTLKRGHIPRHNNNIRCILGCATPQYPLIEYYEYSKEG